MPHVDTLQLSQERKEAISEYSRGSYQKSIDESLVGNPYHYTLFSYLEQNFVFSLNIPFGDWLQHTPCLEIPIIDLEDPTKTKTLIALGMCKEYSLRIVDMYCEYMPIISFEYGSVIVSVFSVLL